MKKKIYIAGKVTGEDQQKCIAKFQNAKDLVEIMGFDAVNPIEVVGDWNAGWQDAMKKCLKALIDCDGILMLDDWHFSKGAKIEFQLAKDLGLLIGVNDSTFGITQLNSETLWNHLTPIEQKEEK